jgi:hypothetical protein
MSYNLSLFSMRAVSFILVSGLFLFNPVYVKAQTGIFSEITYGSQRKVKGFQGEINDYYSNYCVNVALGYQKELVGKKIQNLGFSLAYKNFTLLLKSKNLTFYDVNSFQQNLTLGNDGLEISGFVKKKINDNVKLTLSLSGLYYKPGLVKFEFFSKSDAWYKDTNLYQFTQYTTVANERFNTDKGKLNLGIQLGFDAKLSQGLSLQLSYKVYRNTFPHISEFVFFQAKAKTGGTETMGYGQDYDIPLRYCQLGLYYHFNWFKKWLK